MKTKALCILCTVLVGGFAFADQQPTAARDVAVAQQTTVAADAAMNGATRAFVEQGPATTGDALRGRAGSDCPAGYLAGQNEIGNTWFYTDLDADFGTGATGRVRCEDFPPPDGWNILAPVGIVSWHGTYIDGDANGCEKPHEFRIEFYADDPGNPGNPAATAPSYSEVGVPQSVTAVAQINFGGTILATDYEFTRVLDSAVSMSSGYFSIASTAVLDDCWHLWGPSGAPESNATRWQWYDSDILGTLTVSSDPALDLRYCFAENKAGVCCDDRTTVCVDSNEFICGLAGGRFAASPTTCLTLTPACGDATGACCYDDGTCAENLTYTACVGAKATGPIWLGPGTTCDQCCTIYCDPGVGGFTPEGEPVCSDGYNDTFNTGCNDANAPVFSPITCDETICGTSGTFQGVTGCVGDCNCNGVIGFDDINPFVDALLSATYCDGTGFNADIGVDGSVGFEDINPFVDLLTQYTVPITCPGPLTPPGGQFRDTDWFSYTAGVPTSFTFTVEAEFEASIFVVGNCGSGCLDQYTAQSASGAACTPVTVTTRCLPAGDYYFVVTTADFDGVQCGMDYKAYLTCNTVCDVCSITCDPNSFPDGFAEPELCGEEVNLGCSGDAPYQFTSLTVDPNTLCVNVCGSLWALDGTRDLDYYTFNVPNATEIEWNLNSEVPALSSPIFMPDILNPATCDDSWWFLVAEFAQCTYDPNAPVFQRVAAGDWILFVFPDDGDPIFDGYPCCLGQNEYLLTICLPEPNCPDLLDCSTFPVENQEGEPPCSDGYVDTYNSGCDGDNSVVVVPNALCTYNPFWFVCGNVGSYQTPSTWYDSDWYEVTTTGPALWCIGGQSEVPIDYDIYDAALGCAGAPLWSGFFAACEGVPDEDPLPPWIQGDPVPTLIPAGTYWVRIGLAPGFDVPCSNPGGNEYGLSLGCYTCPEAAN